MKLEAIAPNQTAVYLNDATVFFSYNTPVAAFVYGEGYIKTSTKWSQTTSRHINKWLDGRSAVEKDQSILDSLVDF